MISERKIALKVSVGGTKKIENVPMDFLSFFESSGPGGHSSLRDLLRNTFNPSIEPIKDGGIKNSQNC